MPIYDTGRGPGRRDPRSPADQAGRAPVHHPGRGQGDAHQGLRHGDAGRVPRGQRAALQGARSHPGRFEPAGPDHRPARRSRRRLLSRCRGQALRHHQERPAGSGRAVLLLPRVRPRAPGPELDDLQGPARRLRPGRPTPGPPGDLRGRREPADDPVGGGQPEPVGAPGGPDIGQRSREPGRARPHAGHPQGHADLPVHDRLDLRPGRAGRRRLAGRRRVLHVHAGVDGADPPSGQVHGPRGAGQGGAAGGPGDPAGCRVDGPDPGHVRRVPAGPLAP